MIPEIANQKVKISSTAKTGDKSDVFVFPMLDISHLNLSFMFIRRPKVSTILTSCRHVSSGQWIENDLYQGRRYPYRLATHVRLKKEKNYLKAYENRLLTLLTTELIRYRSHEGNDIDTMQLKTGISQ